ncbi:hypothetical protein N9P58_00335 [Puniceicoccaceae bacterium]|nr:hypothetical protein [Puniceicoccaceae bacterium]
MTRYQTTTTVRRGKEGSALMTAIIAMFVVSLLVGGYMTLASSEYRLATRSLLIGASFSLAEGGVDLAIDALNDSDTSGWNVSGSTWTREVTGIEITAGGTGAIRVVITDATGTNSDTPTIHSEGIVSGHPSGDVTKQLQVSLTSGFFPYKNGFDSKNGFVLKGQNVTMDSYNSANGAYSGSNRGSEIRVSTVSIETDAIDIGNANIFGYVAVGATLAPGQTGSDVIDVGKNGTISSYGEAQIVQEDRILTDYYASFPNRPAPSVSSGWEFPNSGTITTSGTYYVDGDWSLGGNSGALAIAPNTDVILVVTGELNLTGKATLTLNTDATLKLFVEGDVSIGGNGILNSSNPENLEVIGTNTNEGEQTIKINGNGQLSATVYAPNANVELKGGGSSGRVYGAVVAYDASLVGNSHFSFDEALADVNLGGTDYEVIQWLEMTNTTYETTTVALDGYF